MGDKKYTKFDEEWLAFSANQGVLPGESEEHQHVCEFVNVGFHFERWVCKVCDKEKEALES